MSNRKNEPVGDRNELSSDAPISKPEQDAFYRYPFALRIAETLRKRSDPSSTVIAVYGAWGEGKSTVLEFVKGVLANEESILLMPFNPWRFGSDDQLLWTFFATLSETLKAPLKTKAEKLAEWIAEYGEIVIPKVDLAYGAASISAGEGISKIAGRFSTLNPENARKRIEDALLSAEKRVVVIMDDIDRLDRDEIHQVLKLVKLTANFPYIDYLLAFDEEVVAECLASRYGSGIEIGHSFLEKIVQVPLPLPAASKTSLRHFCFTAIDRAVADSKISLEEGEPRTFANEFDDGLLPFLKTPRMAWRYANAIRFGLPAVAGEVNTVDYLLLEGSRLFLPAFHELLREHGLEVVCCEDLHKDNSVVPRIKEALEKMSDIEKKAVTSLLRFLLPQMQSVLGSGGLFGIMSYGESQYEEWAKYRRLCIKEFFPRYFSLTVSPDDFSELSISMLISECSEGVDAVKNWLSTNATPAKAEALLTKIYRRIDELSEDGAIALCHGLASRGDLFSDAGGMMSMSPCWNAARMLRKVIASRVPVHRRSEIGAAIVAEALPVNLAKECLWLFQPSKKENDCGLFSERKARQLRRIVAERALREFETCIPWERSPNSFVSLLYIIAQSLGKKQTEKLLLSTLESNPDAVFDFLRNLTGKSYPLHTGIPQAQDFEKRHLDTLATFITPGKVYKLVKKQGGDKIKISNLHSTHNLSERDRVSAQFRYVFEHSTGKTRPTPSSPPDEPADPTNPLED